MLQEIISSVLRVSLALGFENNTIILKINFEVVFFQKYTY